MENTVISLARIVALDVPRSWQEVVATVLEAGDVMTREGVTLTTADCFISTAGSLRVEGKGSPHGGSGAALATLLAALLEGQAGPIELRNLDGSPGAPADSQRLDELMRALAYFERPHRQGDIAALATRALALDDRVRADAELGRLRTERSVDPPEQAPSARPDLPRRAFPTRAAAAVLMGLLVTAAAAWYLRRPASPPESPATSVADDAGPAADTAKPSAVQSLVSAASDALNSVADRGLRAVGLTPAEPEPSAAAAGTAPAPATTGSSPRTRRAPATGASVAPGATMPTPIAIAEAPPAVTLPVVAADPEEALEYPADSGAFSLADRDVEPPFLIRPQLPTEPQTGAPGPGAAYFELLVNELGEVEQVRLHATEARLQDRMMVSAAKAWRFRPATRNGRPVRYSLRIPITQ